MNRKRFLAATLLALQNAASERAVFAAAPVLITELLPFAGSDRVRIEATLFLPDAETRRSLELHARIDRWPNGGGAVLWEGNLGTSRDLPSRLFAVTHEVAGLKPALWDLQKPNLYTLTVTARHGKTDVAQQSVRFGFRSFVTQDGQFFLNGRRLFLRGNAINAPGRGLAASVTTDRDFAEAYIRDMKSRNINLLRLGGEDPDVWMDLCDELGMLVFQGRYGAPSGGSRAAPPADFAASIALYKKNHFSDYVHHPSVVIDILSNEMPNRGPAGEAYAVFLDRAYKTLRSWEPNRLFIDNAGFGHGRSGDINDQHPYDGWYGGTFLSFYRYRTVPPKVQPITLSETVGAYSQSDGSFEISGKQLAATLAWTGHTLTPQRDGFAYQAFLTAQIIESFRRLRPLNPHLAGVMPFTGIFRHWAGVTRFEQMKPKPVADQMRLSYQPVLLSWELWTPQVYAGTALLSVAHLVNDSNDGADLPATTLIAALTKSGDTTVLYERRMELPPVPYYSAKSVPVELPLPDNLSSGDYVLRGRVERAGKIVSVNEAPLFIEAAAERQKVLTAAPLLYDPTGKTHDALVRVGIPAQRVPDLAALPPNRRALIIGEEVGTRIDIKQQESLHGFVAAGGRVLLLRQKPEALAKETTSWLGADAKFAATGGGMWINPERPDHPVFAGIGRERLCWWSDTTDWNQTKPGLPAIAPVTLGFTLVKPADLERTAVLADFGGGLVSIALAEVFSGTGKGSVLICGFDLVSRLSLDPVADRLLRNLVAYTESDIGHYAAPLIDSPIVWGDYRTERGLVGGPQYGLLVNVASRDEAKAASSDEISFPRGRRPFGPFRYNGNCHIVDDNPDSPTGSGIFFARLPDGRTRLTTTVQNPEKTDAHIMAAINGVAAAPVAIPAGKTVTFTVPLPGSSPETTTVRYTGTKSLILLTSEFS